MIHRHRTAIIAVCAVLVGLFFGGFMGYMIASARRFAVNPGNLLAQPVRIRVETLGSNGSQVRMTGVLMNATDQPMAIDEFDLWIWIILAEYVDQDGHRWQLTDSRSGSGRGIVAPGPSFRSNRLEVPAGGERAFSISYKRPMIWQCDGCAGRQVVPPRSLAYFGFEDLLVYDSAGVLQLWPSASATESRCEGIGVVNILGVDGN